MAALGPVIDVDLGVPGDIFGDGFSGLDGLASAQAALRAMDMDTLALRRMLQALIMISCLLYITHYLLGSLPLDDLIIS